ncbi:hypothetical protein C4J93_1591 [Pseudomonas sp. R2-37-08W]|nr:hypothetical protein C4J93_1591 [Pseudomonas sp. R2-37-08W]
MAQHAKAYHIAAEAGFRSLKCSQNVGGGLLPIAVGQL